MHEILDVSGRTRQRRRSDRGDIQAKVDGTARNRLHGFHVMHRVTDNAAVAEAFLTDFELRLDHEEEIGVGRGRSDERRKNQRQRNERHIADDKLRGGSNGSWIERAHVRPIVHLHARVALQLPRELAITDVDGNDGRCATP